MVEIELERGLELDGVPQRLATLRQLTAADVMAAAEEAERLVHTDNGPALVQSPSRMGVHTLCRQIERVGEIRGPLTPRQLGMMSERDLEMLNRAADRLDAAALREVDQRGRSDPAERDDG